MNITREATISGEREGEIELLLCSARTAVEPAVDERIRTLVGSGLDWSYLISIAREHGVVPLVYRTLRDLRETGLPLDVLRRLRKIFHQWGLLVDVRVHELQSLLTALEEKTIAVISFKGPVFGTWIYGSAKLRKPGDLDLLVRKDDFASARRVLIEAGYEPRISPDEERGFLETRQGFPFYGPRCTVDLHWTLEQSVFDNYPCSFKVSPEEIWWARETTEFRGKSVDTLSSEHHLLYLCAHGAKHSWDVLYPICDVAELIRRRDIDWNEVVSVAQKLRMERVLCSGILLARYLLDAPVPTAINRAFAGNPAVERIVASFSNELFASSPEHSKIGHTVTRLQLLDSFMDRITYLWSRGVRKLSGE